MALTITELSDSRVNLGASMIGMFAQLQPAAADYVTGGYPMYATSGSAPNNVGQPFGMGYVWGIDIMASTGTAVSYFWNYNQTTGKLQVYGINVAVVATNYPMTEVPAGTDLSGGSVRCWVVGY